MGVGGMGGMGGSPISLLSEPAQLELILLPLP
jgi:hypothetical protein